MKKILGDLWYNYAIDKCAEIDSQNERDAVNRLVQADNCLRNSLNKEQISGLEEVCNLLDEANAIYIKRRLKAVFALRHNICLRFWQIGET